MNESGLSREKKRDWRVVGGILRRDAGVLVVENLRRNGHRDWTTPGGVIDPGEQPVEALTREVDEETGLVVSGWRGPVYRVTVDAPELGFVMSVEAFEAVSYSGSIRIDDPDGIVTAAEFLDSADLKTRVETSHQWVSEPLLTYLGSSEIGPLQFDYEVSGKSRASSVVTRLD